jgi:bifunctional DNase/RNase
VTEIKACEICGKQAGMYFYRIVNGDIESHGFCVTHGTDFFEKHRRQFGDPTEKRIVVSDQETKVDCFVHLLFVYSEYNPAYGYIELRERMGRRVFGFTIDLYVSTDLHRAILKLEMARPHLTDVTLKVIEGFSGELLEVDLYKIAESDSNFGAIARIKKNPDVLSVDMRASDGICLALLAGKQIYVPEGFLASC